METPDTKERRALLLRDELASLVDRFDSGYLYTDAFLEAVRELGHEAALLSEVTS